MSRLRFPALLLLCLLSPCIANAQSWQSLFDGHSFAGWETRSGEPVKTGGWEVVDGTLHLDRSKGAGGNLLTAREFGDFELTFEWKLAPGANNGIKYRVNDFGGKTLGLEYQIIDDLGRPSLTPKHRTASIYEVYPAAEHNALRPIGEFNRGRIVVQNNRIEHWLNGQLIAEAEVGSMTWHENIAKSKFADVPGFGVIPTGKIMLTDHSDEVWYRNIFIRDLSASYGSTLVPNSAATRSNNRRSARLRLVPQRSAARKGKRRARR